MTGPKGANLNFPLLEDSIGAVAAQYRLLGVPTSLLVDRDGIIHIIHAGPYTEKDLVHDLTPLLDGNAK